MLQMRSQFKFCYLDLACHNRAGIRRLIHLQSMFMRERTTDCYFIIRLLSMCREMISNEKVFDMIGKSKNLLQDLITR